MAKQIIKLTEGDLHKIIRESVNRVLREGWHDELSSVYDAGKQKGSTGIDIDKASDILKRLKMQYGKDTEGYKQAVSKFFNDREKKDDIDKAKKDPAFELWSDEFETKYEKDGHPMARDTEPMPFNREKYNKRIKNGESPKALRRTYGISTDSSPKVSSPEEIEQRMREMGFTK